MKDLIYSDQFVEQREIIKRLNHMKGGTTDISEPLTFKHAGKLSSNRRAKASIHEKAEHSRELKSLK